MGPISPGAGWFEEGQDILLLGQLWTQLGALLLPGDVNSASTVTVSVYDLSASNAAIISDTSLTVGQVIFTPATAAVGWFEDTLGANFGMRLYDSAVNGAGDPGVIVFGAVDPTGGHRYLVEVKFPTPNFGQAILKWELLCQPVMSQ